VHAVQPIYQPRIACPAQRKLFRSELAKRQQEQIDTAERVKNWYEIIGITLERVCNAGENFRNGDYSTRKDILLSIGCNPILLDRSISI
jgi:hypothetical protein